MKVKVTSARLPERQGGVNTYIDALRRNLPSCGVALSDGGDYDVLLHVGPHGYDGVPAPDGRRSVIVVHDLIPELLLNNERVRGERRRALAAADGVIAVSEWTKADVVREYGIDSSRVHVVYHGAPDFSGGVASHDVAQQYRSGAYLLYVGKRNEYKRFRWLLRAVAPLMWLRPGLRLLCTGAPFCRREWAWIVALGLLGRVKSRCVAAEEMPAIYSNAAALVYPSVYEGFGLPILEAMTVGCPVVCSRSSCLPEVAADAAAYFEADDARSLRNVIRMILAKDGECKAMRDELVRKGFERVKCFSWEKCARETAAVLKSVCG